MNPVLSESIKEKLIVLLSKPISRELLADYLQSTDPLAWIVTHNLVREPEKFFEIVAAFLKLELITELSLELNPDKYDFHTVDLHWFSQQQIFPYKLKDKTYVALANPFLDSVTTAQLEAAIGSDYTFRLCPPGIIKEALVHNFHGLTAKRAQANLGRKFPDYSAKKRFGLPQQIAISTFVILILMAIIFGQQPVLLFLFFLINIVYIYLNFLKAIFWFAGRSENLAKVISDQASTALPMYTLLLPMKHEAAILPQLIANIKKLKYAPEKLDIKIIIEVSDRSTIEKLAELGIGQNLIAATQENFQFHVVKVKDGELSTKPRSLNYALEYARGSLCVIYDAEDRPDPNQLLMAYETFFNEKLNNICIQSKLNFYNPEQNWLTRFFTLEYSFWFDYMLTGMSKLKLPLPLGGTSNHFVTQALRRVGNWDAYNVTEDAELGLRLSRLSYRTSVMNSYTLEEANSEVKNWISQRTRWQKGFIITFLVHIQSFGAMIRELGLGRALIATSFYLSNFAVPLINPWLWVFFIGWYVLPLFGWQPVGLRLGETAHLIGLFNLIAGNLFYISINLWSAIKKYPRLILFALLTPIYWPLLSIASYRALWQSINDPFGWEKTRHGLT